MFGANSAIRSMTASPNASRWSSQVPSSGASLYGRVLDEAADDVLAGRRHGRVDQGRDDHVDVRLAAEVAVLRVVVGLLHLVDRRAEADRAAQVLAVARQAREVGQPIDRQVDLARRAAELEPTDLLLERRVERARLEQVDEGRPESSELRIELAPISSPDSRATPTARPPLTITRATGASVRISAPSARAALPIALLMPPVPPFGIPQARNAPSISPM